MEQVENILQKDAGLTSQSYEVTQGTTPSKFFKNPVDPAIGSPVDLAKVDVFHAFEKHFLINMFSSPDQREIASVS